MPVLNLGVPAPSYPSDWLDRESGRCLVVGGAYCVWDDLRKIKKRAKTICVNDISMHFPGVVNHCYSNNDTWLPRWRAGRRDQYEKRFGPVGTLHSNQKGGEVTWPWPGSGTSSLGAVYTALALGFDEVIIIGVPLDDSRHYFEPPWTTSSFSKQVPHKGNGELKYWHGAAKNVFEGRVTAASGRLVDCGVLPRYGP